MVNVESMKQEIVQRLLPLNPEKIILFGSYAYGTPTDESDIDLFIVKDVPKEEVRDYDLKAIKSLRDLIYKHRISFDVFSDAPSRIENRINNLHDFFYKDIIEKGQVLWEIKH